MSRTQLVVTTTLRIKRKYNDIISSKVESTNSKSQLATIYSNKRLELKRSRSIAVDDATYFDQDVLRETKRKSCNSETSNIRKISLSLPILQTSNYNNQYRDIRTEEIKQATSNSNTLLKTLPSTMKKPVIH